MKLLTSFVIALVLAPLVVAQHMHPTVTRSDGPPLEVVAPSTFDGTFVTYETYLYALISQGTTPQSSPSTLHTSVGGYAGRGTTLTGSDVVSWEGNLAGRFTIYGRVDVWASSSSLAHTTVGMRITSTSSILTAFNKTSGNAISIGNGASGTVTVNVGVGVAPNGPTAGGSVTTTVYPATNKEKTRIGVVGAVDAVDSKKVVVYLCSAGSIELDTTSTNVAAYAKAHIYDNHWLGTYLDAYCPVDAQFLERFEIY